MSKSFLSSSWYRVAHLKPRLRDHTDLHRQMFRGQVWYVLQDHASGRFHRFTLQAYFMIGLMNGRRSLDEIWALAGERLEDEVPTQDEVIRFISQLHAADVLHVDMLADISEVVGQSQSRKRRELMQKVRNPLAVRVPLFDPDRFLTATMPVVRPLLGWFGAVVWLAVVFYGGLLALLHWPDLTEGVVDRVIAADNLVLLALAYPPVKALHELGHGYATKRWGGEVHDIGIMFLVFFPVPYVDASAATAFRSKWRRAFVGAAGILVELFIAAVAMILWTGLEPGIERSYLFNVMLIGCVSTVLFNGNPLLRFDGYHVLADAIEIPNLGARSNQHLQYLAQRYLFGVGSAETPATSRGERIWFVAYGIASTIYRVFIMLVIALFIAGQFFIIGILLAVWVVGLTVIVPLAKGAAYLATNPQLDRRRGRAIGIVAAGLSLIVAGVVLVPIPYFTTVEGVVWVPDRAFLRAGADGFVRDVVASPNSWVTKGTVLLEIDDPLLHGRVRVLRSRVNELSLQHESLFVEDLVKAEVARERLDQAKAELDLALSEAARLQVRSHADGQFLLSNAHHLEGKFLRKGQRIGYVVGSSDRVVRTIVHQSDIDLVRRRLKGVELRYAERLDRVVSARIEREIPAATDELPSRALSTLGGGQIYLDPRNTQRTNKALESLFQLDIRPKDGAVDARVGGRVIVRFDHGASPIALRFYRYVRQLFMARFDV